MTSDGKALRELGWDARLATALEALGRASLEPGRVVRQSRKSWILATETGELTVEMPGRVRRDLAPEALPAVGDWVAAVPSERGPGAIEAVLPRKSALVRHVAGPVTTPQVLAANIDTLFLVSGLDRDYNPRRLERFLALAHESGADPVIVLNKTDICPDVDDCVAEAERIGLGVPVLALSARLGRGVELLPRYLGLGRTGAFVGSSGVGKSSLINALLGEERMATGEVRANDQRGRHVTSHRELVVLPGDGGCLIDTPGIRELQLWAGEEGLARAFADVETVARGCRFVDCSHDAEPGCAVRQAVESGELDPERYESYRQLQAEMASLEKRSRVHEARAEGRRLARAVRAFHKLEGDDT